MALFDLVRCYTPTVGTGTLAIGTKILNDFSAVPDGTTVSYSIMQGDITTGMEAEVGRGVYASGTLTRASVLSSTNGGNKINLNGAAQVVVTALAEDFHDPVTLGTANGLGLSGQQLSLSEATDSSAGALSAADHATFTNAAAQTHAPVTLDTNADAVLQLTGQQIGLDAQAINKVFASPSSGGAGVPTMRALVAADIPNLSAVYLPLAGGILVGDVFYPVNGFIMQSNNYSWRVTVDDAGTLITSLYVAEPYINFSNADDSFYAGVI